MTKTNYILEAQWIYNCTSCLCYKDNELGSVKNTNDGDSIGQRQKLYLRNY